ncbi:NlpC/P60 family protein [Roseibium sp.]|uniref:C40 family peptidase n=1 Tax=Roseibium sp. TaxID=1936156 RepID=UPI003A980522
MPANFDPENFDRRRHPVRKDLASAEYRGLIAADRFVEGEIRTITADFVDMRGTAQPGSSIDTQLIYGEQVTVLETSPEGWAWGQSLADGYVGWFPSDGCGPKLQPTHRVRALRTYRYPGPDLKLPPLGLISLGAEVAVVGTRTTRGLEYAILADGSAVVAGHLWPMDRLAADWVGVAEELVGTPYLWGGRTSLGLDCSALVQISARFGGHWLPRDSDMLEREAGEVLDEPEKVDLASLKRGDLIFWKGHVGIISEPGRLLHSNGHTMTVAYEDLDAAVIRIAETEWGKITSIRRLPLK